MGPGQVFRPPVAISSQGFLILDDERNEIADGLRGEHIVQGGCSEGSRLFRSTWTLSLKLRAGSPFQQAQLPAPVSRWPVCFHSHLQSVWA